MLVCPLRRSGSRPWSRNDPLLARPGHSPYGRHPVVAQILGHSTVTLTLNTYSHILALIEEEAADRMGKLLQ